MQNLAASLGNLLPNAERYQQAVDQKQATADVVDATKSYETAVDPTKMPEGIAAKSPEWQKAYKNLMGAGMAAHVTNDMQTNYVKLGDKSSVDMGKWTNDQITAAVSGITDTEVLKGMLPGLDKARTDILDMQQKDTISALAATRDNNLSAVATEQFKTGAFATTAGIDKFYADAAKTGADFQHTDELLLKSLSAIAVANPELINQQSMAAFEQAKGDKTPGLANGQHAHDFAEIMAHAKTQNESKVTLQEMQMIDTYTQQSLTGGFGMSQVKQILSLPEDQRKWATAEKLGSLLAASHKVQSSAIDLSQYTSMFNSGDGYLVPKDYQQEASNAAVDNAIAASGASTSMEPKAVSAALGILAQSGGPAYPPYAQVLNQASQSMPAVVTSGQTPKGVQLAFDLYQQMKQFPNVLERTLTDPRSKEILTAMDIASTGGYAQDTAGAYAQAVKVTDPATKEAYVNSGSREQVAAAVSKVVNSDKFLGLWAQNKPTNIGDINVRMMERANYYARMGNSPDDAIAKATHDLDPKTGIFTVYDGFLNPTFNNPPPQRIDAIRDKAVAEYTDRLNASDAAKATQAKANDPSLSGADPTALVKHNPADYTIRPTPTRGEWQVWSKDGVPQNALFDISRVGNAVVSETSALAKLPAHNAAIGAAQAQAEQNVADAHVAYAAKHPGNPLTLDQYKAKVAADRKPKLSPTVIDSVAPAVMTAADYLKKGLVADQKAASDFVAKHGGDYLDWGNKLAPTQKIIDLVKQRSKQ
jgi:hypothetical protein